MVARTWRRDRHGNGIDLAKSAAHKKRIEGEAAAI